MSKEMDVNKRNVVNTRATPPRAPAPARAPTRALAPAPAPLARRRSRSREEPIKDLSEEQFEDEDDFDDGAEDISNEDDLKAIEEDTKTKNRLDKETAARLKKKTTDWLDCDDKIKILNAKIKKYKDIKKEREEFIIKILSTLAEATKIDVTDKHDNLKGVVYRQKSITKGPIKEDIIRKALMEVMRDEKKVTQLIKKIENKRPINERYYLRRENLKKP